MQQGQSLTLEDVRSAARFLSGRVVNTPVLRSPALDAIAGAQLWLKAECMQHVGAFKARGALFTVGMLSEAERARGVVTYSSGNHGQAVALAAKEYGIGCEVAMPEDAPAIKVEAVKRLGARVTFAGLTSDDRKRAAQRISERSGAVIIAPFDHPDIVAGQGTATLELVEEVARQCGGELDALLVPVGGGGLIAGGCLVAAASGVKVYSVEPAGCDAMAQSIERGERVSVQPAATIADGLKPVRVGELNFAIAQRHLAGCLRVSDEQIGCALASLLLYGKVMVEPSGAAALAAALERLVPGEPERVGVILSGGNLGRERLAALLERHPPHPRPGCGSAVDSAG